MKREWQQQNALASYNIKFSVCVTTLKMHHGEVRNLHLQGVWQLQEHFLGLIAQLRFLATIAFLENEYDL